MRSTTSAASVSAGALATTLPPRAPKPTPRNSSCLLRHCTPRSSRQLHHRHTQHQASTTIGIAYRRRDCRAERARLTRESGLRPNDNGADDPFNDVHGIRFRARSASARASRNNANFDSQDGRFRSIFDLFGEHSRRVKSTLRQPTQHPRAAARDGHGSAPPVTWPGRGDVL